MNTRVHPQGSIRHASRRTALRKLASGALLALGALSLSAGSASANNTLSAGAGGTSVYVNGTNISTSSIDLEEFGKLQGVPASTVRLELEGVAVESPERSAVDQLVSGLAADTPLATALSEVSSASGGTLTPSTVLTRVISEQAEPGAAGASGAGGAAGSSGAPVGGAATPGTAPSTSSGSAAKKCRGLRLVSRRLTGRASAKVRIRFTLACVSKVTYGGRRLAKGSHTLRAGHDVLILRLPRAPGTYLLTLTAASASGTSKGEVTLVDRTSRADKKRAH